MAKLELSRIAALTVLVFLGGCAFVSHDQSVEALLANADTRTSFQVAAVPGQACPKAARMLSWCAGGPNFHYRCNISQDGGRAELVGILEAIYRTEYFMVTEFVRGGSDSTVTVHQHDGVLIYDYAPMIEKYFGNTGSCQPR